LPPRSTPFPYTTLFRSVLAKSAITVDHACNGRLILGIGAGWFEREHTAYGIPFYTAGGRARRLRESVEVLKALFTQPRTTYKGRSEEHTSELQSRSDLV